MSRVTTVLSLLLGAWLAGCSPASKTLLVSDLSTEPAEVNVQLGPSELYMGLEAHRALLRGNAVVLDTRNWSVGKEPGSMPGRLTTDVIDLGSGAVVSLPVKVTGLTVTPSADAPTGSKAVTYLRHGSTFFQAGDWSKWQVVEAGRAVDLGTDRYVQLCIELVSNSAGAAPAVKGVTLGFVRGAVQRFKPAVTVTDHSIRQIVNSTIRFGYERMDQKDLVWLRKVCDLDKVIAGGKTELDRLIALNEWTSMRKNVRGVASLAHMGGRNPYPWNIRKIFGPEDRGTVYGHCGSYSQLLITAACALGWQARHIADEGYRANSHEVVEIWVNGLGKWVYFDPSLGTYYTDRKGNPLGILEMHDLYVDFFLRAGETLKDFPRLKEKSRDKGYLRRKTLNFAKFPAICHTNNYTYGEYKEWDWTSGQGILTAGFLQLTPRNNFNSQPKPVFWKYGHGPAGVNGFPYWTDEKTPLWSSRTRNWFTRRRDWNWTLNQASLRLIRTGSDQIAVELGNSQPFFRKYLATVNGAEREIASPFLWKLTPGKNTLTVNCVDEFGRKGLPSGVTVKLKK